MENLDLIILIFACYTKEEYKNQIDTINATWAKKCEEYKNIKISRGKILHKCLVHEHLKH